MKKQRKKTENKMNSTSKSMGQNFISFHFCILTDKQKLKFLKMTFYHSIKNTKCLGINLLKDA